MFLAPLKKISWRVYSDYLMPSRIHEYERFVSTALSNGFSLLSLDQFLKKYQAKKLPERYIILRHDIDSDPDTALIFSDILERFSATGSFYFRKKTLDLKIAKAIQKKGHEASYHFEELSYIAKKRAAYSTSKIKDLIPEASCLLAANISKFEKSIGSSLRTICAHGDFVNRRFKVSNVEAFRELRTKAPNKNIAEAYDDIFLKNVDIYLSDDIAPDFYTDKSIFEAINTNKRIYFLVHPKHWKTAPTINTWDNLERLFDELKSRYFT